MVLAGFGGCSNDEQVLGLDPEIEEGPQALAKFQSFAGGGSVCSPTDFVHFQFGYRTESEAVYFGGNIRNEDEGQTIELNEDSTQKFISFFSMINNGEDDLIYREFSWGSSSGGSSGGGNLESEVLIDRVIPSEAPDLNETPAIRAEIHFERVSIECPGRDPNGDGNWLDFHVSVVVSFYSDSLKNPTVLVREW